MCFNIFLYIIYIFIYKYVHAHSLSFVSVLVSPTLKSPPYKTGLDENMEASELHI